MTYKLDEVLELEDEELYDYLVENGERYTKTELKTISKSTYISSNQTNKSILNQILRDIAVEKVNGYLYPGEKYGYIKLDKIADFTPTEKINFIKKYGKYLNEYEYKSLIFKETNSSPPTYVQLLENIYLEIQKDR